MKPSLRVADLDVNMQMESYTCWFMLYALLFWKSQLCQNYMLTSNSLSESFTLACHCMTSPIFVLRVVSLVCNCFCTVGTFFTFFGGLSSGLGFSGTFDTPGVTGRPPAMLFDVFKPEPVACASRLGWPNEGLGVLW